MQVAFIRSRFSTKNTNRNTMNKRIRNSRLASATLAVLCMVVAAGQSSGQDQVKAEVAADPPPNIVFIFVDDQGYYDLGCYGATEVKTPRIDAMAKEGTRFTDYYAAAPICSPSRAGLLTGCYPRRVGNEIWVHRADSRTGIHPDELTIAELFKDNGYATACIGKWHLGFHEPFLPRNQGFDHYFGLLHNLDPVEVVYFEDKGGVPLMRNGDVVKRPADPAELTKLYTDEAIEFIEKNKEGPFFLYLPHTMLHNPLGVSEEFKGSSNWGEYGDAIPGTRSQRRPHLRFAQTAGHRRQHDRHLRLRQRPRAGAHAASRRFAGTSFRRTKAAFACRRSPGGRDWDCRRARNRRRSCARWIGIRRSPRSRESRFPKAASSTGATSARC